MSSPDISGSRECFSSAVKGVSQAKSGGRHPHTKNARAMAMIPGTRPFEPPPPRHPSSDIRTPFPSPPTAYITVSTLLYLHASARERARAALPSYTQRPRQLVVVSTRRHHASSPVAASYTHPHAGTRRGTCPSRRSLMQPGLYMRDVVQPALCSARRPHLVRGCICILLNHGASSLGSLPKCGSRRGMRTVLL
jgi:hypothetical protein